MKFGRNGKNGELIKCLVVFAKLQGIKGLGLFFKKSLHTEIVTSHRRFVRTKVELVSFNKVLIIILEIIPYRTLFPV
jgi:hypothetical protein